ncbi:hypothetical protein ARMSODRAFT_606557 [Armillaria solidipes]|uniref:Uncharacterized protein n=1 Tax=Armillaria solidipes TaxID=1076256 RepID=A0A2H3B5I1_9AGAR|nr:hypothetical protein ARMSODRAFT_606557 [Armillaria solidipes]
MVRALVRIFASDHEDDTSLHNGNLDTSNYSATSTMDHDLEETPVEIWKRWWARKKFSVSRWWREQKMSVSKSFAHSRVSWYYDKEKVLHYITNILIFPRSHSLPSPRLATRNRPFRC